MREYRPNKECAQENKPATYRAPTPFITMSALGVNFDSSEIAS